MSAKDTFHGRVREALVAEGWIIAHDPYRLTIGKRKAFIDLGAEMPLAADKDGRKIAVEVKSFLGDVDFLHSGRTGATGMGRIEGYGVIVRRVFEEIAALMPSEDDLRTELVIDETAGHYQLGQVGWERDRRVDDIYLHVDVSDDKVWVQHDGTDLKVAEMLVKEGIPRDQIVLAFHPPRLRKFTDFAAA